MSDTAVRSLPAVYETKRLPAMSFVSAHLSHTDFLRALMPDVLHHATNNPGRVSADAIERCAACPRPAATQHHTHTSMELTSSCDAKFASSTHQKMILLPAIMDCRNVSTWGSWRRFATDWSILFRKLEYAPQGWSWSGKAGLVIE